MNMPTSKFLPLLALLVLLASCREESRIYGLTEVGVQPVDLSGKKEKTPEQYIAILYANLFQKAMSPNQLVRATELVQSIGDKQVAYETLVSRFMNDPAVVLPSVQDMREDPEAFVTETYRRFFVRVPSEGEKTWLANYIRSHPEVTPEHIYYSFAISNEYYFY
jgi:hypothetical protein